MSDNDQLIEQFKSISGIDTERARFYLESSAWNIETALSSFYEGSEEPDPDPIEVDVPETDPSPSEPKSERGADMPSLNMESSDDSSSEEEGQAFYAGGSVHSGQQVIGAGKKKKKNVVSKLFKSAKAHGAEVVDDKGKTGKGKKINFHGTGYRLGETEDDHEVVARPPTKNDKPRDVVLGMWKTGFTVDNGAMRPYEDPANMEFLNSVRRGQVPLELIREAKGGEVFINMEDHRHEDYVTPKQNLKAFSGSGQTLGSICPTVVGQVTNTGLPGGSTGRTTIAPKPAADTDASAEAVAKQELVLDSSQPTTNIQLRLPDGSRLIVKVNHSHTVGDLRRYARTSRDNLPSPFALMTTFPYVELTDDNLSISDANLLHAAIVIKPK